MTPQRFSVVSKDKIKGQDSTRVSAKQRSKNEMKRGGEEEGEAATKRSEKRTNKIRAKVH